VQSVPALTCLFHSPIIGPFLHLWGTRWACVCLFVLPMCLCSYLLPSCYRLRAWPFLNYLHFYFQHIHNSSLRYTKVVVLCMGFGRLNYIILSGMFVLGKQYGLCLGTVRRTSVRLVPVQGRLYRVVLIMRQKHKPSKTFLQVLPRTPSDQAVNGFGRGRVRVLLRSVFVR